MPRKQISKGNETPSQHLLSPATPSADCRRLGVPRRQTRDEGHGAGGSLRGAPGVSTCGREGIEARTGVREKL